MKTHQQTNFSTAKITAAIGVALVTASCSQTNHTGPTMATLPPQSIGSLDIGTFGIDAPAGAKMQVVTFDNNGKIVGQLKGDTISGPQIVAWKRGIAVGMGDTLQSVTGGGRSETRTDEAMAGGAAIDQSSERSIFWFNTGAIDGTYKNNFITLDKGAIAHKGSIPGYIFAGAQCEDRAYVISTPSEALNFEPIDLEYSLHSIDIDGRVKKAVKWKTGMHLRPAIKATTCTDDHREVIVLYRDTRNNSDMTLARIDAQNGEDRTTEIDLGEHQNNVIDGTLSLIDGMLYWVDREGCILSTSLDAHPKASKLWSIPGVKENSIRVSVTGRTVSILNLAKEIYEERDLITGEILRSPVKLSWLKNQISAYKSGGVTSVASIPQ